MRLVGIGDRCWSMCRRPIGAAPGPGGDAGVAGAAVGAGRPREILVSLELGALVEGWYELEAREIRWLDDHRGRPGSMP